MTRRPVRHCATMALILTSLGLSGCTLGPAAPPTVTPTPAAVTPAPEATLVSLAATAGVIGAQGVLSKVDCTVIGGAAWSPNHADDTVKVAIFDGATLLRTLPADKYFAALATAGVGNGNHGFLYVPGANLKDGKPHTIHAHVAGSNVEMKGSPASLTCPPK